MEYSSAAWERAILRQDVILRALSGEISWCAAADILQMTLRNLRRWRERYERWGDNGLVDQRRRGPSKRRVPLAMLERLLRLYRERYAGFNGRHFHEIARREHGITLSYSYVKQALQQAGLLPKRKARGRHRRRREPRACVGELLHLDGNRHAWLAPMPGAPGRTRTLAETRDTVCQSRAEADRSRVKRVADISLVLNRAKFVRAESVNNANFVVSEFVDTACQLPTASYTKCLVATAPFLVISAR